VRFTRETRLTGILDIERIVPFVRLDHLEWNANLIGDPDGQFALFGRDGRRESQDGPGLRGHDLVDQGRRQGRIDATGKGNDVMMLCGSVLNQGCRVLE
jgi:hypothetical protein